MEPIASNKIATAAQRQQLQQSFDRALRLNHGSVLERATAVELFRQCFAADPGNLIYAQSWLRGTRESQVGVHSKKPLKRYFLSRRLKKAMTRGNWQQIIDLASRLVEFGDRMARVLSDLATACSELEHDSVAILILRRAAEIDDEDDRPFRQLAVALERVGDFPEARRCWLRINELCPGDDEAAHRLKSLGQRENDDSDSACGPFASGDIETHPPQSLDQCLQEVEAMASSGDFEQADQYLRHARSLFGNDIRLRERSERLLLDQIQYEIAVAEKRLEDNPAAENQELLEGLQTELNRREIDFYATRSRRYPQEPQLKMELGLRLKRAGIYAEAIAAFVDLLDDDIHGCAASVETGECWQSLRQYDRALRCYREAMKECPEPHECFQRSRYRAAVLLEAMGSVEQAESLFAEIVQVTPTYKDAANRLDKIRKIRHDA